MGINANKAQGSSAARHSRALHLNSSCAWTIPSSLALMVLSGAVFIWRHQHQPSWRDVAIAGVQDILALHNLSQLWLLPVYTMLVCAATSLVWTVTVVIEHFVLVMLHTNGIITATGGVDNPMMTYYDVIRFFANGAVSVLPTAAHMLIAVGASPYSFAAPTVASIPAFLLFYLPATLAIMDVCHYFSHRFLHQTKVKWLFNLHRHHHMMVVHGDGMLCTDLQAVLPIEYWFTQAPSFSIAFVLFPMMLGSKATFWGWAFGNYMSNAIVQVGHSNYNIPVPQVLLWAGYAHASDHAMHHHDVRHNFSIFSCWMDRLMGSYKRHPAAVHSVKLF